MKTLIVIIHNGGDLLNCFVSCEKQDSDILIVGNSDNEQEITDMKRRTSAQYLIHAPTINSKNVAIEYAKKNLYDYLYCIYSDEYFRFKVMDEFINFVESLGYDIAGAYSDRYVEYTVSGEQEFVTREYLESCDSWKIWDKNVDLGNLLLCLNKIDTQYSNEEREYNFDFLLKNRDKLFAHFHKPVYITPYKAINAKALYEVKQKYVDLYI